MSEEIQEFSYISLGGGLQSTLFCLWLVDYQNPFSKRFNQYETQILFADTGGEEDHTYSYLNDHLIPYLSNNNKQIITVRKIKDGIVWDLDKYFYKKKEIPMGWANPKCSSMFKSEVINNYVRQKLGIVNKKGWKYLSVKKVKIYEIIGIGEDEITRLKPPKESWKVKVYPYFDIMIDHKNNITELNLGLKEYLKVDKFDRETIKTLYATYNMPVPEKSGCWFCPNKPVRHFVNLKLNHDDKFQRLILMEDNASEKNVTFIKGTPLKKLERDTIAATNNANQDCNNYCFT